MYLGNKKLLIPFGYEKLRRNMLELCPEATSSIDSFITLLQSFQNVAKSFSKHDSKFLRCLLKTKDFLTLTFLRKATLQDVFDKIKLPKILQTLVAGQLIDYMLPANKLSFLVWAALFNAYNEGSYYPEKHFKHFVDSLCQSIVKNGGEIVFNEKVVDFITEGKSLKGVHTKAVKKRTGIVVGERKRHIGNTLVCNFDPKMAASMIGEEHFSKRVRKRLAYDYSYSSFVVYAIVEKLDLTQYGFGNWNIWHCQEDLTKSFDAMYNEVDYSEPYFAMNCHSLHTADRSNCRKEQCQVFQICTVANYDYWKDLKLKDRRVYYEKKEEVYQHLIQTVEKHYVPSLKEHIVFKMSGSPTTNERYVFAPKGGSYGVNLTPRNFSLSRKLTSNSSLSNLYFCSAAAGVGGFAGTIATGIHLYEKLTSDYVL